MTTINAHNDLCDLVKAPQHLYAPEELDLSVAFNRRRFDKLRADLLAWYQTPRAVYSTDKGRHFVQVDGKHLYELSTEYEAVSYASRINNK